MIKYFTECTQLFVQNIHTKREHLFHDILHTSETRIFLLGEGVTDITLSCTNIQTLFPKGSFTPNENRIRKPKFPLSFFSFYFSSPLSLCVNGPLN